MASSSPAKVSVDCPHCGFKQMEYAAAKTTMCRQCGKHYSRSAPKVQQVRLIRKSEEPVSAADPSFLSKFDGLWASKRNSVVECFECKAKQEVSGAASSTICPACSAHIDLRDYKVATSFSRTIRTHGELHLTPKGDLSSSSVICRSALIEGKLRGNLTCSESAVIHYSGKIPGRLNAGHVVVERKADVQFFRRLRVKSIEIKGRMSGEIIAETVVVIHKTGSLDGNVTARSISVEKGGVFSGQLVIGERGLTQAELIPAASATTEQARSEEKDPMIVSQPLPATS